MGAMLCPQCGVNTMPVGNAVCGECATNITLSRPYYSREKENMSLSLCPRCRSQVPNGMTLCTDCFNDEKKAKLQFTSGATSTKQPRLSLIPSKGLVNAAIRFELGIERHGEQAYNGLAKNSMCLTDRDFLIERCSHAITHLYYIIDILRHESNPLPPQHNRELADNAGAVAWAGLVLGEAFYVEPRKEERK